MQATTTNDRKRARKYATILDGLMQEEVEISAVSSRVKQLGGIDAAYEAMRTQTSPGTLRQRAPSLGRSAELKLRKRRERYE